jgi:hypothetical protein
MLNVQPDAYRKTGTPTTNHTSRAPNKATRATASRLMPWFLANNSRADFDARLLPISGGTDVTTANNTQANSADISHKDA